MREKVNLLHTIKKKDIRFMKRVGAKTDDGKVHDTYDRIGKTGKKIND